MTFVVAAGAREHSRPLRTQTKEMWSIQTQTMTLHCLNRNRLMSRQLTPLERDQVTDYEPFVQLFRVLAESALQDMQAASLLGWNFRDVESYALEKQKKTKK